MDPLGPVVITSREIYDQLVRVAAAVDRVSNQLVDMAQDLRDHENRLRALERARWPLPALAVLVAVASLGLSLLKP